MRQIPRSHRVNERRFVGLGPGRRAIATGVAALVVALAAAPAGAQPRPGDGGGPDPAYQWVVPPADDAATNVVPIPTTQIVDRDAPATATVTTGDRQAVVRVAIATLPAEPVVLTITPLDPSGVARPRDDARAVGNAYRIDVRPAADAAGADAPTRLRASVLLVAPRPATAIVTATDDGWTRAGPATSAATIELPATVLLVADASDDDHSVTIALRLTLIAALAIGGLLVRRRRARR